MTNKDKTAVGCNHCDDCGGKETYKNQASLPINGKVRCIDWCIHRIIAALNAGGIATVACCCGHQKQTGRIDLEDGRVLFIYDKKNPKSLHLLETCKKTEENLT